MWDLVPWPGFEPKALALGTQGLSHWTTREVPVHDLLMTTQMALSMTVDKSLHGRISRSYLFPT